MIPLIYRIRDWDELYEPSFIRLSPRESMKWVALPTKQDGHGYLKLVTLKHGAAYLGAWVALLQVAAKCFPRGILIRSNGKPHDALSLSLLTRLPSKLFDQATPILADDLAWLEVITLAQVAEYAEHSRARYARVRDRGDNTVQDKTVPDITEPTRKARGARAPARPIDDEYLVELQASPVYSKLDVRIIYLQMIEWCKPRHKLPTRRRLVTFLNNRVNDLVKNRRPNETRSNEKESEAGAESSILRKPKNI